MDTQKIWIYQLLPRLFGNTTEVNRKNGSITLNGCGKFNHINAAVLKKIRKSGYTHVWYIGVIAHASATDYTAYGIPKEYPEIIKGKAGSPYAIRDYYDVDPDLAVNVKRRMKEFDALLERTQKAGLKVIIDFVPNHVARNYRSISKPERVKDFGENDKNTVSFSPSNNFYYLPGESLQIQFTEENTADITYREEPAKATGNDCFTSRPSQYDWYETVKLNYGVDMQNGNQFHFSPIPDTWKKMKDILLFWASKNIGGFRCDMAEMVPVEFWYWVIPQIKKSNPEILFIAEIYNPAQYKAFLANNAFDYLYDKVGLYDILRDVACGYRPASDITFALNNVGDIQHRMLNFIENHDEQRLASDYFLKDGDNGKAAMLVTACVNTNPVMVYFGQELGERGMDEEGFSGKNGRTSIFDYWAIDTIRRWNNHGKWNSEKLTEKEIGLQRFYSSLITLCNTEKALSAGLFYDLMPANYENPEFDSTKQYAFLRSDGKEILLIIANFSETKAEASVHIPEDAYAFFGIQRKEIGKLVPLLSHEKTRITFSHTIPMKMCVEPNSGEIYKISFF